VGHDLFIIEVHDRPYLDTRHSVGLLWASDQPKEEASTSLNTTLTTERRPFCRLESNPQSQQASGRRARPYVSRPLGLVSLVFCTIGSSSE